MTGGGHGALEDKGGEIEIRGFNARKQGVIPMERRGQFMGFSSPTKMLYQDRVHVNEEKAELERLAQDVVVPEGLRLPARSRREEWAGHVRNAGFAVWGFGLAIMFGVPSWGWWEKCVG